MVDYGEIALTRSMSFLADSQAAIANNLANVNTDGFKRKAPVAAPSSQTFHSLLGTQMPSVNYTEYTDWRQGTSRQTDNRFNVAIDGPNFFRVQNDDGKVFYTREGNMHVDDGGRLVTPNGLRYLDDSGAEIVLQKEEGSPMDIAISPTGLIVDDSGDGQTWGPIGVFEVGNRNGLRAVGDGLYVDDSNKPPALSGSSALKQSHMEGSNVESLEELVRMITVQRSFQATQRALSGIQRIKTSFIQSTLR